MAATIAQQIRQRLPLCEPRVWIPSTKVTFFKFAWTDYNSSSPLLTSSNGVGSDSQRVCPLGHPDFQWWAMVVVQLAEWSFGCFRYQRTRVRMQSSENFIEHLLSANSFLKRRKIKKKESGNGPFLKTCSNG